MQNIAEFQIIGRIGKIARGRCRAALLQFVLHVG